MLVGWRDRISINPEEFARLEGRWAEFNQTGLYTKDFDEFAQAWGLAQTGRQSYTVDGFAALLESAGPLWIGRRDAAGHAVCVYGLRGDGTPEGTYVIYNDPLPMGVGTAGKQTRYDVFSRQIGDFITTDENGDVVNQILHAHDTGGRAVNTSSLGISRPLQAAEVGAAVVGAVIEMIGNNEGDVHWNLARMTSGIKRPWDRDELTGPERYETKTLLVPGPHAATVLGLDEIWLDCKLTFQHNGRSIRNVRIDPRGVHDAAFAGLKVTATIDDEANAFPEDAPRDEQYACLHLGFEHVFEPLYQDPKICRVDFDIFGNGTFSPSRFSSSEEE
jgi:Papain-like cysteine protease AvrRpt2